jgi:hypothetical protein
MFRYDDPLLSLDRAQSIFPSPPGGIWEMASPRAR